MPIGFGLLIRSAGRGSNPMLDYILLLVQVVVGVAGGVAAWWLPPRGKAGLALSLLPLVGFPLWVAFC